MHDPTAEFINTIKIGNNAGHKTVVVSYSKFKEAIAECLRRLGYVSSLKVRENENPSKKLLEVTLSYGESGEARISGIDRVSKVSRRLYAHASELFPYRNGAGNIIVSTPKGVLSEVEARKQNVGGEILFKIW